jgi:peptide/nickel transport system substrate-binding protein
MARFAAAGVLAIVAGLLLASSGGTHGIREGGTFRIGLWSRFLPSVDPALVGTRDILDATCAGLMNMPDKPAPANLPPVPEIAAGSPKITNGGKTYTFTIRKGVRFSTGAPVTARSFAFTINRLLNPTMDSFWAGGYKGIVGAQRVIDGKAQTAAGIVARGDKLTIRLKKPVGGFHLQVTAGEWGFCVLPETTPIDPEGVKAPVPSAGPYYVSEYVPDERVVLERNRFYHGDRPQHVDRFVGDLILDPATILDRGERGEFDWARVLSSEFGERLERLRQQYGVNRSRFFVAPARTVNMFMLNTSRPLFRKNPKLRQALNFAVDRKALTRELGPLPLSGTPSDQYLSPGMAGFRNERIYPLDGPDLKKAKQLAKGHMRSGKAVLYAATTPPRDVAMAQILQRNLKAIGLELEIKEFPTPQLVFEKLATPGEPFDIARVGFTYAPDPSSALSIFDGRLIGEPDNDNFSYFNSPKYNRLLEAASRLPPGPERYRAYGELDVELARNGAPAIPLSYLKAHTLVGPRTGCVVLNPGLDITAVCLK